MTGLTAESPQISWADNGWQWSKPFRFPVVKENFHDTARPYFVLAIPQHLHPAKMSPFTARKRTHVTCARVNPCCRCRLLINLGCLWHTVEKYIICTCSQSFGPGESWWMGHGRFAVSWFKTFTIHPHFCASRPLAHGLSQIVPTESPESKYPQYPQCVRTAWFKHESCQNPVPSTDQTGNFQNTCPLPFNRNRRYHKKRLGCQDPLKD